MDRITYGHDSDGPTLELVDTAGDSLEVYRLEGHDVLSLRPAEDTGSVWLDREGTAALHAYLGDYLERTEPCEQADRVQPTCDHAPDATADGYDWPDQPESIALEAHGAVYGDRQADYGHPRGDFTRQAIMWTALLQHKLAEGEHIEPSDVGRCMVAVKLARDVHSPKRDNRVDMAGYAITLDRLETGR